MKIVLGIFIILLIIYMADLLICSMYSAMKKKKDYVAYQQKKLQKKKSTVEEYNNYAVAINNMILVEEYINIDNKGGYLVYQAIIKWMDNVSSKTIGTYTMSEVQNLYP